MNESLHKMTGISISNQYPGPHKAHCAACNSTFKIDWGVILSIKQYEVAKSIKNLEGYKRLSFFRRLQFTEKSTLPDSTADTAGVGPYRPGVGPTLARIGPGSDRVGCAIWDILLIIFFALCAIKIDSSFHYL